MAISVLVLLLAAVAVLWVPAKPQPVRVRRNLRPEELLAAYMDRRDS